MLVAFSTLVCQCQSEFLPWLVIAISESTKAYKSKWQNYNNISGKDLQKRNVFRCRWKTGKDGDDCTSGGREFHVDGCSNWKWPATESWQSVRWDVQLVWRWWVKSATTGKVGDMLHAPTGLNMVAQAHVALGTPWHSDANPPDFIRRLPNLRSKYEFQIW